MTGFQTCALPIWATFQERLGSRDFDAINAGWALPLESDPGPVWHSKHAPAEKETSNHAGLADARVDELIEGLQRENDGRSGERRGGQEWRGARGAAE